MPTPPTNANSAQLTHGWQKGLRTFFWGLGFSADDFDKPQVGIGTPLNDGNLCNVHAHELATRIAESCRAAGMIGFPFGVPAVSDNLTQALEGGNASLPSRNAIADAAEMVSSAHCHDALIGLHHCDKNGPGFAMALARLNVPGLIVSGGSILPGCLNGQTLTIQTPYDALAQVATGTMDDAEVDQIIRHACPGPGGCGIAASFNTWAIAMEAIGLMLPYSASNPAVSDDKKTECDRVGTAVRNLLEKNIRPRDILTPGAFANATTAIAASGGSTNGILHILALAREAGVDFTLTDIQKILRETPVLCDFAPRGTKTMVDLHDMGGTPVLLKHLLGAGILDGSQLTVSGETLADNLADAPPPPADNGLIVPADQPLKPYADMQICFGNLSPDGMVFKVSSMPDPKFRGTALCFSDSKSVQEAVASGHVRPGHVVVLRYQGPVACGMPEVLVATSALAVPGLKGKVAIVSDTRVSGVSHGAIGVHCTPEAAVGGPIALVEDGDEISFDLLEGDVTLHVDADTLTERRKSWNPPDVPLAPRNYLANFSHTTTQANQGCISKYLPSPKKD
ncbi:MAG: dihydroxy-acid dehydratase [Verrucomicrobiales bacterium]|nr:dihydroxy-acid dehydratase [Verrucomicrobiales bacterium]